MKKAKGRKNLKGQDQKAKGTRSKWLKGQDQRDKIKIS